MLTGATLAAFPSKALCITAKACQMPELQASMKTHIRPSPWLHESLCMSVKSFKPLSLQTSDTLLQKRSRALSRCDSQERHCFSPQLQRRSARIWKTAAAASAQAAGGSSCRPPCSHSREARSLHCNNMGLAGRAPAGRSLLGTLFDLSAVHWRQYGECLAAQDTTELSMLTLASLAVYDSTGSSIAYSATKQSACRQSVAHAVSQSYMYMQ